MDYHISTAGHCPEPMRLTSSSGPVLTYGGDQQVGFNEDAQSHLRDGSNYPAQFWAGSAQGIRPVHGQTVRAQQAVGDFVCKYGRVTDRTCGEITSRDAGLCGDGPGGGSAGIRVQNSAYGTGNEMVKKGDSGGPLYLNYDAWGTTSCLVGTEGGTFVAIDWMLSSLRATLKYAQ